MEDDIEITAPVSHKLRLQELAVLMRIEHPDDYQSNRLDRLARSIEAYEEVHHPIELPALELYGAQFEDEGSAQFVWARSTNEARRLIEPTFNELDFNFPFSEVIVDPWLGIHGLDMPTSSMIVDGHSFCSECWFLSNSGDVCPEHQL